MQTIQRTEPVHIGLRDIDDMLTHYGWNRSNGQEGEHIYSKNQKCQDEFRIRLTDKFIIVAVPIKGSDFLFATKLTSYFKATEFVEQHLLNYEGIGRNVDGSAKRDQRKVFDEKRT